MKTKLFRGLVFAAALLVAGPAFAASRRPSESRGHAVAAVHRGGGGRSVAVSHASRGASRSIARSGRSIRATRSVATRGRSTSGAARGLTASRSFASHSRASAAFGGSSKNSAGARGYKYAFGSHPGWNTNRGYAWNGHHYRWFNNAWYIVDPFGYYAGYPNYGGYGGAYDSSDLPSRVQNALEAAGYYNGPIDGIIGNGTRGAIAAYQHDYGLAVTGTITPALVNSLGIS